MLSVRTSCLAILASTLAASIFPAAQAADNSYSVLHTFVGEPDDGDSPKYGAPAVDKAGNVYGVTVGGGANNYGVVYKIGADGTYTVLHAFTGTDGAYPYGGVLYDKGSNTLFGTTEKGGASGASCSALGCGVVYALATDGTTYTVLHYFTGSGAGDGYNSHAAPIRDKAGNLYGTASGGGPAIYGTVWKLARNGVFSILHGFGHSNDGTYVNAPLFIDKNGNLFGTTTNGGGPHVDGTVFKIAPDGTYTTLHGFRTDLLEGVQPYGGVIQDKDGNLYGTASGGGPGGKGTVWKVAADGTFSVIHAFTSGDANGATPYGGLVLLKQKLYGTNNSGGSFANCSCGVVFEIDMAGNETVLHTFMGGQYDDGSNAYAGLAKGPKGFLYGQTFHGGENFGLGTVYHVKR